MTGKALLVILFSFCAISLLTAQSHLIRGTVTDESGSPMPFVTVFLTTSQTGTVTNNNGAFSLSFSGNTDTLRISFIGYETQRITVSKNTESLRIQLKPFATQLAEFTVSGLSADGLLRKAIGKIPDNFRQEPFLQRVYVRHKLSEADTLRYMQEFALNIVRSYRPSFSSQIFLIRNRNFSFTPEDRFWVVGAGGHDVVGNAHRIFNARFFRNHDIRYLAGSSFDNRSVYVLGVSPRNRESGIRGKIYIDEKDLAFVRFELDFGGDYEVTVQYEKVGNKYYMMNVTATRFNRRPFDGVIPVQTNMITTAIIHSFSPDDIEGVYVDRREVLRDHATQEDDTLFWQQHNAILPDSAILEALERYRKRQKQREKDGFNVIATTPQRSEQQQQAFLRRLYTPNLSLMASSDFGNDFSTFNHNFHSVNRYVSHLLDRNFRRPIPKMLALMTYNYLVSVPLGDAASEWLLLNKNGIHSGMNPTMFNRYQTAHLFNVSNDVLHDFRNNNHFDFMRLHTIRNDGRYVRSFLIEEEVAKINLSNRNNRLSFMMLYWQELYVLRMMNMLDPFWRDDIDPSNRQENRQSPIVDRGRSWVSYLFNPEMDFQRHVREDDLTDEEQRYFRRARLWSLLNLGSPQMFLLPRFSLGENHSFTFSLNYLPVPFGEMFAQNIWFMQNHNQLHGVFLRQYRNFERTSFGIGYRLYDVRLFPNMYVTSSIDFWQQPTDFSFRTTSTFNGFRVGQTFEYRLLRNQFSGQSRLSILVGYDYKTKGYMPESFFMGENFNVSVGFRWNFR